MITKFLNAKHWQLFLLTFGIPMVVHIATMVTMFASIATGKAPDPLFMLGYVRYFQVIMMVFIAVFFGWFWSVATGLQAKVPDEIKMKVKKFKRLFFIPLIYIILILTFVSLQLNGFSEQGEAPNVGLIGSLIAIIMPLHFFSMFCIFYSLYFVAKTIKTVELQREVRFSDFAGEFFMIWFYPIGIWILQPKINKMIKGV